MGKSDYLSVARREGHAFNVNVGLPSTEVALTTAVTVKDVNHTIFVQRITLSVTTHVDGKTFDVQDTASSPKLIARHLDDAEGDATGETDFYEWDFGSQGIALTEGKSLQYLVNTGGSGMVGQAQFQGYQKRTAVGAP